MSDDQYLDGKLNEEDEGVVSTLLGIADGRVIIQYPKPITWVGYDPDSADQFADAIKEKAAIIRKQRGE